MADEYIPKFEETEEIEEVPTFEETEEIPTMSRAEAALEGIKQGPTFGFSDELAGLIGAGLEGIGGERLPEESAWDRMRRTYREYRDVAREKQQRAEEEHPGTYMAADIASSFLVPGAALKTGGKAAAGLTRTTRAMPSAAKTGAKVGALEAAGRTEEDITTIKGLMDVGAGALAGGTLGWVVGKMGARRTPEALEEAAQKAERESNIAALKSIGAKAKDIKDEFKLKTATRATSKTARGTGKTLMEEDLVKARQSAEEAKDAIVAKMDEIGSQRIEPAAKQADALLKKLPTRGKADTYNKFIQKGEDDVEQIASKLDYAKSDSRKLYQDMTRSQQQLIDDVDMALESEAPITALNQLKRKLQGEVNWSDPQASPYNEFLVKKQAQISELMNELTAKVNPELAQEMIRANKAYSNLTLANRIAGDEMARDMAANLGLTWKDALMAGVVGASTKSPLLAATVVGVKKGIEKTTGKPTGRLLNTLEALHKARKAQQLRGRVTDPTMMDRALRKGTEVPTARTAMTGAAVIDEPGPEVPYKKNAEIMKLGEMASPEEIMAQAANIRQQYGKDGEKLAATLEKISERDRVGRRALIFSLMQDPRNREMLGLE